jgi:protein-S-isoprenylcysteine O-methyltransferase Ste14
VRYVPIALLALFHALIRLRSAIHRRRTGTSGNFLGPGRTRFDRWRAISLRVLLFAAWVDALCIAAGRLELAPAPLLRTLGAALALGSALLMFAAQLQLGDSWRLGIEWAARPGLVVRGMYRWTRNPIYLWMLLSWTGLALLVWDPLIALIVVVLYVNLRVQVQQEELWLLVVYGQEFREYASRVGRFLPGIGRLRA